MAEKTKNAQAPMPPIDPPDSLSQRAGRQAQKMDSVHRYTGQNLNYQQAALSNPQFQEIVSNQSKLDLVRGIPDDTGAGIQYLPGAIHERFNELTKSREMSQEDLRKIREKMLYVVNEYVRKLQQLATDFADAAKQEADHDGSILSTPQAKSQLKLLSDGQTIEQFQTQWLALFDVAVVIVRGASENSGTDTLWNQIQPIAEGRLEPKTITALENILAPNNPAAISSLQRDQALDLLRDSAPLGLTFDTGFLQSIDAAIVQLEVDRKQLDINRSTARRRFNNAIAGTYHNAEAVLSFATLDDGSVDLQLLDQQLVALGVVAPSSASALSSSLAIRLSDSLKKIGIIITPIDVARLTGLSSDHVPSRAVKLNDTQRDQLIDYIRQIQEHDDPGFSVVRVYEDAVERSMMKMRAEQLVEKCTRDVAFDFSLFESEVKAIQSKYPEMTSIPSIKSGTTPPSGLKLLSQNASATPGGIARNVQFLTPTGRTRWINALVESTYPDKAKVEAEVGVAYDRCIRRNYFDRATFDAELQKTFGISASDPKVTEALQLSDENTVPESWDSSALTTELLQRCKTRATFEDEVEKYLSNHISQPFLKSNFATWLRGLDLDLEYDKTLSAIGIPVGTNDLPDDWDHGRLVAYLRRAEMTKRTGLTADQVDLPWNEDLKEFARTASNASAASFELWWNWMKSLPSNVYDADEKKTYSKNLERWDALKDARDILTEASAGFRDRGKETIQEAFDEIRAKQTALDELLKPMVPAQRKKEHIEGISRLYALASSVFDYLEHETNFASLRDPVLRRKAFYIAMSQGVEESKKFLQNPDGYNMDDQQKDALEAYLHRFDQGQIESGRDILTEMRKKYGIMIPPTAWLILTRTMGPHGAPLSVGPTRVENWLSHPELSSPALRAILQPDPLHANPASPQIIEDFVMAFSTQQDVGTISSADASQYVGHIVRHLLRQSSDAQMSGEQHRSPERFVDPLNLVRTGWDSVREMLNGDAAQKTLGISLIVGAGYALYSMWKKGGVGKNLMIGLPMFFGMDVALKNATGNGLLDRLGMNYMSPEQRHTAREQFLRSMAKEDDQFAFLDSDLGDACLRELAHPKNPLSVSQLLQWRESLHSAGGPALFDTPGAYDFSTGAPAELRVQPIVAKMGILPEYMKQRSGLRAEAYRKLFLTFEALCVQVANINDLGGDTLQEKAERGAALIKHRYVEFDDQYLQDTGMGMQFAQAAGPNVSILDVMIYERTTPAVTDAMINSTFAEWMAAKFGIGIDVVRDKLRRGWTWAMIEAEARAEQVVEDLYPWAKKNILSSYDSFREWAYATYHRGYGELSEDWLATYHMLYGVCANLGIEMRYHAPGVIEWTYDQAAALVGGAGDKVHRAWLELHRHHVTGPAAEAVESLIQFLTANAPMESAENLADVNILKRDLATALARVSDGPSGGYDVLVQQWLLDIGVADLFGPDLISKKDTTPRERLMKVELLKREVFSYLIAKRMEEIRANMSNSGYKPGSQRILLIQWPTLDAATFTFTVPDPDVQEAYAYVRSRYTNPEVLTLMGQERTFHGALEDYAAIYPGTWTGDSAGGLAYVTDWFLRDTADEYTKKNLSSFLGPLDEEAKRILPPNEYQYYKHYLNTLALNVLIEASVSGGNPTQPSDIALPIQAAKDYLYHLRTKRGQAPDPSQLRLDINAATLLSQFHLNVVSDAPKMIKDIQADPNGKWLLQGVSPSAPSSVSSQGSGAPQNPTSPRTTSNAPRVMPSSTIDGLIRSVDLTKLDQAKQLYQCLVAGASATQVVQIRQKFDAASVGINAATNPELALVYLLGVNDAQVYGYESKIIPLQLKDMSGFDTLKSLNVFSDPEAQKRADHLRWRLATHILPTTVRTITSKPKKNLLAATASEQTDLARMLNEVNQPALRDAISLPLEYIFCDGDWGTKDFGLYNTFLTSKGVSIPMPPAPTRGCLESFENACEERFRDSDSATPGDMLTLVSTRLQDIDELKKYP